MGSGLLWHRHVLGMSVCLDILTDKSIQPAYQPMPTFQPTISKRLVQREVPSCYAPSWEASTRIWKTMSTLHRQFRRDCQRSACVLQSIFKWLFRGSMSCRSTRNVGSSLCRIPNWVGLLTPADVNANLDVYTTNMIADLTS